MTTTTRRRPPSRANGRRPSATTTARPAGHGRDVTGLGLAGGGVLVGLGVYANLAGPAGQALDAAAGAAFGAGRFGLPLALAGAGAVVLRRRPHEDPRRLALGALGLVAALAGLVHLVAGGPGPGSPVPALRVAGGMVGAVAAAPLRAVLGPVGAALVLATVAGLGALVVARTTVRSATERAVAGGRRAATGGRRAAVAGRRTAVGVRAK
ncbi:MAG: DNA translocase FtsK 4TM domain-containing protein, partial [Actinobacteria bacterium]|nr:DNA translocase FtsK 4TM domain-containing protein [Actinomycetota bacterium]